MTVSNHPMGRVEKSTKGKWDGGMNIHQRHVTLEENAPPRRGPTTDAMPYAEPMRPVTRGRCFGLAANAMIVYAPDPTPAPPSPAIARPTMSTVEVGATPQIKLPSSNKKSAKRKVILRGKYLYPFPHVDWDPPKVMK
jgi:hypothetical protein